MDLNLNYLFLRVYELNSIIMADVLDVALRLQCKRHKAARAAGRQTVRHGRR